MKGAEFETKSIIPLTDNCQLVLKIEKDVPKEKIVNALLLIDFVEDDYKRVGLNPVKFVEEDEIIPFDEFRDAANYVLKSLITQLVADSKGAYLITRSKFPCLPKHQREYASDGKIKAVKNLLNEYKFETFLIECYQTLVKYKGSDTFERRRLEKMLRQQEGGKVNVGFFY